jgi:hypothetical protein
MTDRLTRDASHGTAADGRLRAAITGMLGLAATEEQALLAQIPSTEQGSPQNWAALPVIAHNTEFRRQQVERLRAIRRGEQPAEFGQADHQSADLYRELSAQPAEKVAADSWLVAGELIEELQSATIEDLTDPGRNAWLKGRQLWLQVVVRGFWHPAGHLGEYYLNHRRPERAVALAAHAVETAGYLEAPAPARGMASYNLACVHARAGELVAAAAALADAVRLNPDLRDHAARDTDLTPLRDNGGTFGASAAL